MDRREVPATNVTLDPLRVYTGSSRSSSSLATSTVDEPPVEGTERMAWWRMLSGVAVSVQSALKTIRAPSGDQAGFDAFQTVLLVITVRPPPSALTTTT